MASEKQMIDGTTILDMEIMDGDQSDYEVDLSGPIDGSVEPTSGRRRPIPGDEKADFMAATKSQMASGVASYVWEEGRQRAKNAFNIYGNIDILRPYFDVEPNTVRNRLIHSLIPKLPRSGSHEKVPRELYGPTMIVLTLIALLLFQMKSSGHTVQEGTLMGSAFGVCFTYWFGTSSLLWFLAYVCNTHITSLQILSLLGYALFGHCVVLFTSTIFHSHSVFYLLWFTIGGLSCLRVVSILFARTSGRTQRMIVCGTITALHMLFLLYLHFAYHQIVEEISMVFEKDVGIQPKIKPVDAQMIKEDNVQNIPEQAAAVTDSVKRVIREAKISDHLPQHFNETIHHHLAALNDTVQHKLGGLLEAIKPQYQQLHQVVKQSLHQAVNQSNSIIHRAVNGTI